VLPVAKATGTASQWPVPLPWKWRVVSQINGAFGSTGEHSENIHIRPGTPTFTYYMALLTSKWPNDLHRFHSSYHNVMYSEVTPIYFNEGLLKIK